MDQSSPFSLAGKTIVVAGASSGIGLSICRSVVAANGKVIGLARREDRLQAMVDELGPESASCIKADLSKDEDIENAVARLPEINGYVHAAGIIKWGPLKFIKRQALEEIMNVNYYSMVLTLAEMTRKKKIKKQVYSSVVVISSVSALVGSKSNLLYTGSKGAMSAAARVIASEYAAQKIRVNAVEPAMVHTDMASEAEALLSREAVEKDMQSYPFGYGTPEDVANATVFLLSDASRWITGQSLVLDGGWLNLV
ncbi:MAG: SDR family oxidoreductase [Chitinophagaceae bacterium]|nr:SDR family oxidoreductase [Chitinophagaceae bacterium]